MGLNSTVSRWLPFGTRADARVRLLCLPHAGAGASSYRSWASGLPEWIDVCPIQLPGREARLREKPFEQVGPLVEELAGELEGVLDIPYAVFGHSLGALVAYELTRRLAGSGAGAPAHLFVAGRPAPQLPYTHARLRDLGIDELAAILREFGGTSEAVLRDRTLLEWVAPMFRADFSVNETYTYIPRPPLEAPITVFGATADPRADRDQLAAWRECTSRAFTLHMLDGGHFAVLEQAPQVHTWIVEQLRPEASGHLEPDIALREAL